MSLFFHRNIKPDSDVISASHTGPVIVYMAPADSNGEGDVWFKIYEDGWSKDGGWATDKLIKNNGEVSFKIPSDIRDGKYLLRGEVIALHNARSPGGAQFFPNCAHIDVMDGGNITPKGVSIPGVYKADDPGILYSRKKGGDNSKYVIPGPPVYQSGSSGSGTPKPVCKKKAKRSRKSRKRHDL
ncbi:hypothetical protein IWQ56_002419 [Coemansia nantahalensis]|uniref:Uncharacterized protein n=2 Tax=Coemansia TaxID=4863 RepID=A0ACC1L8G0_9FUNG|nr:hypothetical protein IWQ56_002419 [Coemansia nantahalensis]KAJ2774196.1 hypothetical protein IWQ57_000940 [Coemansia nantahalensis]KAJ2802582.1 hypothetical protein H4R21_002361 [Coemansia helicoidea]